MKLKIKKNRQKPDWSKISIEPIVSGLENDDFENNTCLYVFDTNCKKLIKTS